MISKDKKIEVKTNNKQVLIIGPFDSNEILDVTAYANSGVVITKELRANDRDSVITHNPELAKKVRDAAKAAVECGQFGPAEEVINSLKAAKPAGPASGVPSRSRP